MIKGLVKVSTLGMERDEWLDRRRKTIGGSEASAILGLNPWCSPYTVWADKLGKLPPKEDNEPLRLGRDLEDYVAKRFTEATGKKVRRENAILYNEAYPFAHANVDRVVIGEDAGLECKTTSVLNLKKFKGGEYPANYYCQCMHYMMVTGAKRWYLAVLVLGSGFFTFEIERDEDEIAALIEAERSFYENHILTENPPIADGSASTTDTIGKIYPEGQESEAVNLMAYDRDMALYLTISAQIKELERSRDEAANRIKAFLGESEYGASDKYNVSWSNGERRSFDYKSFQKEHSDIDLSGYFKVSKYRTFKIQEQKN
jgi:putative phage-type endonuclease